MSHRNGRNKENNVRVQGRTRAIRIVSEEGAMNMEVLGAGILTAVRWGDKKEKQQRLIIISRRFLVT
jgi:hypothetical protein